MSPVPGLAGFMMSREQAAKQESSDLQHAQAALTLQGVLEKRKREGALQQILAQSGGDPERAVALALQGGHHDAAVQLAPLAKMKQEQRVAEETRTGMRALLTPQPAEPVNPMVPGPGASVMAGSGSVTPTAPTMPNQTERRVKHLDALAVQYANNPTVLKMIETEKGKIIATAEKPTQKRDRVDGETLVQEEFVGGKWVEIGRGPRFARQIPTPAAPQAPTVTEIADPNDPTKSIKIDAKTGKKIGDAPPRPKAERALPGPLQKQLTELAETSDASDRFVSGFKDEYSGYVLETVGDAANWVKRKFGDESGQAQFWQDYKLHESQIRNRLFGSALTAPEIKAWKESAIDPSMEAKQVKTNLERRAKLEKTAIERLMNGAVAGGYSKDQIEAFTGRSLSGIGGRGGDAGLKAQVEAAGIAYEPDKYEYRVNNGQVQRKARGR